MPSPTPAFDTSAGSLCLDFANTWADRERPATDQFTSLAEVLAFARQNGLPALDPDLDPAATARTFARARELRDAIYGLCSDRAAGRSPDPGRLLTFNRALGEALGHLRLEPAGEELQWGWGEAQASVLAPLWPILRSAAELLASPEAGRIRECAGSQCTWLFLDRSRAGSRRWCSMTSCGNRAKARRHYRRGTV